MDDKENSKIVIGEIKGDVVISQNQQGGITAHDTTADIRYDKQTRHSLKKVSVIIGTIASLVTILGYFDFTLPIGSKTKDDKSINTVSNNFKEEQMLNKKDKQISIGAVGGDVVISQNQTGGITAHTVTINNKIPKRSLKNSIDSIVKELKKYPIAAYRIHYSPNDPETNELANDIDKTLIDAGWQRIDPIKRLGGPNLPKGITVYMLRPEEPMLALTNQLWSALGNKGVEGNVLTDMDNIFKIHGWSPIDLPPGRGGVVIFIGPNPED